MAKIDLSEFLQGPSADLSDLLPPELPKEVLSNPELVQLNWLTQKCSCGREYSAQEFGPLVRHTISRRMGFGLRQIGKVFIPLLPGLDISDLPIEKHERIEKISNCPACIGQRPSLPLFPDQPVAFIVGANGQAMSPHVAAWTEMHKTSKTADVEATLKDMHKRGIDFDDLLAFKTTESDLQSIAQSLCDPETIQ